MYDLLDFIEDPFALFHFTLEATRIEQRVQTRIVVKAAITSRWELLRMKSQFINIGINGSHPFHGRELEIAALYVGIKCRPLVALQRHFDSALRHLVG